MFGKPVTLFKLLGFSVRVDASWAILAALIVWTLAAGYFPFRYPGLPVSSYWWMGAAGAVGLFLSIIAHEFAHSVVARRYGIPMKGITLFIFGGVAEMDEEPRDAGSERRMALAGPTTSVLVAILCYGAFVLAGPVMPLFWSAVLGYLAFINILLAVFNMLPAFPLDGGRVLRAYLWGRRKNLHSATRTASKLGAGFGMALIVLGVLSVITGNFVGGMWWTLIGLFLRGASKMSYRQLEIRQALKGEPISHFMREPEATVQPSTTLRDLMDQYFHRYYMSVFPVTQGTQIVGCADVRQLKTVPRSEWDAHRVAKVAGPCDSGNTIQPDAGAIDALTRMMRGGRSWLVVADSDDRLEGMVTLPDLLKYVAIHLDLDGSAETELQHMADSIEEPALRR